MGQFAIGGHLPNRPTTPRAGVTFEDLTAKFRLYAWSAAQIARRGRPDVSLGFLGGIGDDLLCTTPIEEWLRRGARRVWFFTRHPDLYAGLDRRIRLLPEDARLRRIARRLGRPMRALSYTSHDPASDREIPVARHLLAEMCRRAGLTGRVRLRPHLPLNSAEQSTAKSWSGCIAVQSSGLAAAVPMANKEWRIDRMQEVVDDFAGQWRIVQIGSAVDPPLRGAEDWRGRTRLRESAVLLAGARIFIGLEGFLMHLARAVECPAVIVYGGRVPPEITGYVCNRNLAHRPPCAPCWQYNRCDYGHACMESIGSAEVIAAVRDLLALPRGPLAEEEAEI